MSPISSIGKAIIVLSLSSFAYAVWLSVASLSVVLFAVSLVGVIGGVYLGLLGVKVDALERDRGAVSHALRRIEAIEARLKEEERRASTN